MDDLIDLEGGEHPVDRRPRRLHRITLTAPFAGDAPADLKARPRRRTPRPDASDILTARLFLDGEHPKPYSAQWPEITAALRQPPISVVIATPSGVMKRAVPGSDSIAVFAAMSLIRHGRRIRRAVSIVGPSTFRSFAPGLSEGIIGFLNHVFASWPGLTRPSTSCLIAPRNTWKPGSSPGMTTKCANLL